jgi:hypothetical protein
VLLNIKIEKLIIHIILKMSLTESQQNIYNELKSFIKNTDEKVILVNASAGTGKTYILSVLTKNLLKNQLKICIACPTHVALNIIQDKINSFLVDEEITVDMKKNLVFQTIHQLLRYTPNVDKDGVTNFTRKLNYKLKIKYDLIIFDECSMIEDNILDDIIKTIKCKIIFNGDSCQLPPINYEISKIFKENYKTLTLTEIIRTQNNELVSFFSKCRELMCESKLPSINKYKSDNIKNYTKKDDFIQDYINNMQNGNNILLAYHVETVKQYNTLIRHKIFQKNTLQIYEEGDYLIFDTYYVVNENQLLRITDDFDNDLKEKYLKNTEKYVEEEFDIMKHLKFYTSEKVKILKYENKKKFLQKIDILKTHTLPEKINEILIKYLEKINNLLNIEFDIYELYIIKLFKNNSIYVINQLNNKQFHIFNKIKSEAEQLLNVALNKSYNEIEKMTELTNIERCKLKDALNVKSIKIWKNFYYVFDTFAFLNYGYSLTIHKSQSTTFNNVYVDMEDCLNSYCDCKINLLYTAMTRTSNNLIFYNYFNK